MADSSKMSLLKVSMNYTTFNTLKLHANAHSIDSRPTIKGEFPRPNLDCTKLRRIRSQNN